MKKDQANKDYSNASISALKGADRVRKRPSVIFGSDGLEGCEHSAFEIISNAIDEAREGYGDLVAVTLYEDHSIEVEDFGRGCPVDFNPVEQRFNWELVFCELYAGGKYQNNEGTNYEYSLGLNGLGSCATQYSSEYMDVTVRRDGKKYTLHFEKGENVGGLHSEPTDRKKTGSCIKWRPDLEVFTDINIPADYFIDILKRQAVVNAGLRFQLRIQRGARFETSEFYYENGISDYVKELAGRKCSPSLSTGLRNAGAGTGRTSPSTRSSSPVPSALPIRIPGLSITTTPPGWSTAARRTRRCAAPLSPPSTASASRMANTRKMRARWSLPTCRTAC